MDGIKVEVTGNIARVIEKPTVITSGTVGLPAEFTFDDKWAGLSVTIVFTACDAKRSVEYKGEPIIVPWEVLEIPGVPLFVGVYGSNEKGGTAIPTTWASVGVIKPGATLDGDPSADPKLPIWGKLLEAIELLQQEIINMRKIMSPSSIKTVTVFADKWVWVEDTNRYEQVVQIPGVTSNSQVDITPTGEQLDIFYGKNVAFVAENHSGTVIVCAIGEKPKNDYTFQVTITEVSV